MTTYTKNFHKCVYTKACMCVYIVCNECILCTPFQTLRCSMILAEELVLVCLLE